MGKAAQLQWSRPQLRTETQSVCSAAVQQSTASMEPSSVEDGNSGEILSQWHTTEASMEPSSVEDGNVVGCCTSADVACASMEPSSVEDGNKSATCIGRSDPGASMEPSSVEDGNPGRDVVAVQKSVVLQWSRPQLRTETTGNRGYIVSGSERLQWSRPQLRTETGSRRTKCSRLAGFNGAVLS